MSHEIETALFSNREGAGWTGLGRAIPESIARDPAKIAEMLNATWTVQTREVFYKAAPGTDQERFLQVAGAAAQVRSDNGHVLSLTSDNCYHLDNRHPIDVLEAFRDQLNQNKLEISHAAVLRGGAIIAVSALLPSEYDLVVGKGDVSKRYVTLSTGYDKKNGTKRTRGGIRVVCANTWAMSVSEGESTGTLKTIKASTKIEVEGLAQLLASMEGEMKAEQAKYDALANQRMSDADVQRYFGDVLKINISDIGRLDKTGKPLVSSRARNMLTEMTEAYHKGPGAQATIGTAWGAFNAATYYATHLKTARDTSNANDGAVLARIASNMTGSSHEMKVRALALLSQKTKVAIAA